MYIPKHFAVSDHRDALDFMKRYSFATIIGGTGSRPVATHLPFMISVSEETIVLSSHFARANDQWRQMENGEALVIFNEPHAYISPSHYERELNVPTWNYVAVHAYGSYANVTDDDEALSMLEEMIHTYEEGYRTQWDRLPVDYKLRMLKGIVPFKITVAELQAKEKLSQNRSLVEQQRIVASLGRSDETPEKAIAAYMQQRAGGTRP